jgi:hypothetical protein
MLLDEASASELGFDFQSCAGGGAGDKIDDRSVAMQIGLANYDLGRNAED